MAIRASKVFVGLVSLAMIVGTVSGAQADPTTTATTGSVPLAAGEGAAFAMSNGIRNNSIVSYRRAADGSLTRVGSISTRGSGIGVDLDTQGPLRLSSDHRYLYAVNAGTDDVSVFGVNGTQLTFLQRVYAGDQPVSLTINGNLLYVLDGSVASNGITGFTRGADGMLTPIANSTRALSSPIAVPGQIEFSPDGRILVVTEKTTNTQLTPANAIDIYRMSRDGRPSFEAQRNASFGLRPFGMAFRNNGQLSVVESFNADDSASALSTYQVDRIGNFTLATGSDPNHQTDACWVVVTPNGRYAYTANFGSGTISAYQYTSPRGETGLLDGDAAFLGADSQPVDLALTGDGAYLYLLLRGTGAVAPFEINKDGSLSPLAVATGGLPVADGASGLAVY